MIKVLLTCAGRRHYLVSFFNEALSGFGKVVGTDMDLSAPALAACSDTYLVPSVFAPDYLEQLRAVIRAENVNMVFSLNDLEIGLLAASRDELERETGATFYVPPPESLRICGDKWATYRFAQDHGIPVPVTFLNSGDALKALRSGVVKYPLFIKPRWGSASIGLFVVECDEELENACRSCAKAVAKSSLARLGEKDSVIIQEFVGGSEYGVDVLYGKKQECIGYTAKRKLAMRAGETDMAVSVDPMPFDEVIKQIGAALPHRGNLDCDFLECDGQLYLLELNPRFGGGYPFTHLVGANHVQMLLDDYQGKPLGTYGYQVGKAFSKYDMLVEVPAPPLVL